MQLDSALKEVSIIGAAGKMGKGIAVLLLQEMAKVKNAKLHLIDSNSDAFSDLREYLEGQLLKYAEKNINQLRIQFKERLDLVSNKEIIDYFVFQALKLIHFSNSITAASSSFLVFEAIVEEFEEKVALFSSLKKQQKQKSFFFTNTSSIPIHLLNDLSSLDGHIIGFHFYNPPVMQKVIELVVLNNRSKDLKTIAEELAKRLNKIIVSSSDVAGFIGNGYIMREILYACQKAKEFGNIHVDAEGICLINTITKDFLLRPMGIFQLIDYIGIDVCQRILKVMRQELKDETLHEVWIDQMLLHGKKGGQTADGKQMPGFFEYDGLIPKAVYSFQEKNYIPIDEIMKRVHENIGEAPNISWKILQNDPKKNERVENYLSQMQEGTSLGSEMARKFLHHSKEIIDKLLQDKVARTREDINLVLEQGFYFIYEI